MTNNKKTLSARLPTLAQVRPLGTGLLTSPLTSQ